VDGFTSAGFGLVELPKGSSSFEAIKINQSIGYPGSVQWDGKHVTVDDGKGSPRAANVIWRFAIRGTRGKYVGSTPLEDGGFASLKPFTWIFGSRVIAINLTGCAITCGYDAPIYDYPAGGSATKLLGGSDSFANVTGITVSLPH
jgi:hypothetical protein